MNATIAAAINKKHERFEVGVFSPTLGKFVPHFKQAIHSTIESAMKLVSSFKTSKWEIQGLHRQHKEWHPVKTGKAETV